MNPTISIQNGDITVTFNNTDYELGPAYDDVLKLLLEDLLEAKQAPSNYPEKNGTCSQCKGPVNEKYKVCFPCKKKKTCGVCSKPCAPYNHCFAHNKREIPAPRRLRRV